MAERNIPVFIQDDDDNSVRVGWASEEDEAGFRDIRIDISGPGKEAYDLASQGPAQGFTYGEPVNNEENN